MNLIDLLSRRTPPAPFEEFDNIPWNEPGFSKRMLKEHLDQSHDMASRRQSIIEAQVDWIHRQLCDGSPARILDLGCGPGFYTNRLASIGHSVDGIDWSPASIAHARKEQVEGANFIEADIRSAAFGTDYDLTMLIFGEFNVFSPNKVHQLLSRIASSLKPGGRLLLEISPIDVIKGMADTPGSFRIMESGLFSEAPHLLLEEAFWEDFDGVLTKRYTIVDLETADVSEYGTSYQTWTDSELALALETAGFGGMSILPGMDIDSGFGLMVVTATKA